MFDPRLALRCAAILFVLLASLTHCTSMGRSVGRGVAQGVAGEQDTLASATRRLIEESGRAFADSVSPKIELAVARTRDSLELLIDRSADRTEQLVALVGDSVSAFLAAEVNDSLAKLVDHNAGVLRRSIAGALREWSGVLRSEVDTHLARSLAGVADSAAQHILAALAASLDSTGAVGPALVTLGEAVVRQAIQTIAEEAEREATGRFSWVLWVGGGLLILGVGSGVGRFVLLLKRRTKEAQGEAKRARDAVRVMGAAIQETRDSSLAAEVKRMARHQAGLEPWINEMLREERLLVDEPQGGKPDGP